MNKHQAGFVPKIIGLFVFFILSCLFAFWRLVSINITGDSFADIVSDYTTKRTVTIKANRGEIFDRNGVPLVQNQYSYNVELNYRLMSAYDSEYNDLWLKIREAIIRTESHSFLDKLAFPFNGSYPDLYWIDSTEEGNDASKRIEFARTLVAKEDEDGLDAAEVIERLCTRYGLVSEDNIPLYSDEDMQLLLAMRFEAEYREFGAYVPFVVAENVGISLISYLKEENLRGVEVTSNASRKYCYPGYASHILGRVGPIQQGTVEYYTSLGYAMNAIVGIDGAEAEYEEYLHGTDGKMVIVEDLYGNIVDQYISVEPVAGQDVWLTIDIELQIVAENALKDNIEYIVNKANSRTGTFDGEDANAGAMTIVDPNSGEVLALASYPTYDLSTFRYEFSKLNSDPDAPLINRALNGRYAPGSTFKPATAIAALEEGVITKDTIIYDRGIYKYYPDYQPRCWIYLRSGGNHGALDVIGAIRHSCNYFFYEAGRLLTIEKLNDYCSKLGLGQPTGIEFSEFTGVLAGPDYTENNGLGSWSPGDTLQAAIGQSYNVFTPLQLSCYISTLINGGVRYSAHLLHSVRDFMADEPSYTYEPEILDTLDFKSENVAIIKEAMRSVMEDGSASSIFSKYPISMGGKTGTAQVNQTSSDNAVFVAFAPFDEPQLVVSIVVEHGNSGTDTGIAVRDVFDYYFGVE
jgi:penicillin-binding protein 2